MLGHITVLPHAHGEDIGAILVVAIVVATILLARFAGRRK